MRDGQGVEPLGIHALPYVVGHINVPPKTDQGEGLMKGDEGPRNMAAWWVEAIGLLAGALGIVAWVPQIREVWVHHRHEGISLPTFGLVSVALLLWLVYGLLVESPAMIIANIATLAVILAVVIGVARLRRS